MAIRSERSVPPASLTRRQQSGHPPAGSPGPRQRGFLALAVLVIYLVHPLTWGNPNPPLWIPAAGLGLALLAWNGPVAGLVLVLGSGLAIAHAVVLGTLSWSSESSLEVVLPLVESVMLAGALLTGWFVYRRLFHAARGLNDPRSAILFLLLLPGAAMGLFALARTGLTFALVPTSHPFLQWLAVYWLSAALGVLALTPPALAAATPWLTQHRLARADYDAVAPLGQRGLLPERSELGDALEIIGLALGAGIMGMLLVLTRDQQALAGWQLWGAPLLLIFWASMRQGLRGGTIVAATAAALPLLVLSRGMVGSTPLLLFQGNLLAQCSTGLLVAASASWIRASEERYRLAISHTPVVLYTARFEGDSTDVRTPIDVTLVSEACHHVFGCTPAELLGDFDAWVQRIHPDDREIVRAAIAQLRLQAGPVTCEYRLGAPLHDGPWDPGSAFREGRGGPAAPRPAFRWLRDTLAAQVDADGRLIGWQGVVSEITEQRALADDLRRTTSMFHALVSNLPAGVFFVQGPNGRPILANARARQLLGRREDTAAGVEHFSQVYHLHRTDGTLYPAEELPVARALRQGTSAMRNDIVVHRPDGRELPLVSWAAPVHLAGPGTADAAVWVFEDLTVLHQAETARRDSEGRLRAIIATMSEALIVLDRAATILDCNPAACALFGFTAETLRGRGMTDLGFELLDEEEMPLSVEQFPSPRTLTQATPMRNLIVGLRPKGGNAASTRWTLCNAAALGPSGAVAGAVLTFVDITNQRRVQQILRHSEERYRGLVESLPLLVFQLDRNLRVTYANPAAIAVTGYSIEEIADPVLWFATVHSDDQELVRNELAAVLAGDKRTYEVRFRSRDGVERTCYTLSQPIVQDGQITGVTALLVDLTRERALEQELHRVQRLELIGRLASGVAHDFRNLLGVVAVLTDLARRNLPTEHPAHEELERIGEAVDQASQLAGQLLSLARQRRQEPRPLDLHPVARRAMDLLRPTLPANITVEDRLAPGRCVIRADETQIQQVLMNLCLNARDALPHGGTIQVSTEYVDGPSGDTSTSGICLKVRDTGQGMSEQVRARVFDPFFSTKEKGTGLGLAIVQQIVESFGGRVEVTSQPGVGSEFQVWLPLDNAAEAEPQHAANRPALLQSVRE